MFTKLSTLAAAIILTLAAAQDQCNLLPVAVQELPLYSLVLHTLNKTNQTLCERYTPANSTQLEWITQLVNLAFTGDFVPLPDLWPANPNGTYQSTGILDPMAVYRDPCYTVTKINLVPYFNGTYKSNNRDGVSPIPLPSQNPRNVHKNMKNQKTHHLTFQVPTAINFLDSGSVPALRSNIPAWSPTSNQYHLFTHLYQYIGLILGCTAPSFPKYTGNPSQAQIHRFMDLPAPDMHYFIHNIYDAAVSLGVQGPDLVTHVGDAISIGIALDNVFNKRCSPKQQVATYQSSELQSMCGDEK